MFIAELRNNFSKGVSEIFLYILSLDVYNVKFDYHNYKVYQISTTFSMSIKP